jgi:hypothetical protein
MKGTLTSWDFGLGGSQIPKREEIIANYDRYFFGLVTRYLVSTPWGVLLQVRVLYNTHRENNLRVEIDKLDLNSRESIRLTGNKALQGHIVFL